MFRVLFITIASFYMTTGLNAQVKDQATRSQEDSIHPYKYEAWYDGDLNALAKTLEKKFALKKPRPSGDSSVAFRAFVDKNRLNELQEIELIEGSKSPFSDFILQGLIDSGKTWISMLQGGRRVKSYIRVDARLNSDGSISITTGNYIGALQEKIFL